MIEICLLSCKKVEAEKFECHQGLAVAYSNEISSE